MGVGRVMAGAHDGIPRIEPSGRRAPLAVQNRTLRLPSYRRRHGDVAEHVHRGRDWSWVVVSVTGDVSTRVAGRAPGNNGRGPRLWARSIDLELVGEEGPLRPKVVPDGKLLASI